MNYPKPNHRPCGDVDIWGYGDQEKADALLEKEKDIHPIKSSHHTIFNYEDVENHITFIEVDCHEADGSEEVFIVCQGSSCRGEGGEMESEYYYLLSI